MRSLAPLALVSIAALGVSSALSRLLRVQPGLTAPRHAA